MKRPNSSKETSHSDSVNESTHSKVTTIKSSSARQPNKYLAFGFKIFFGCVLTLYVFIPLFVRLNPWILTEVVFLHRLRWPPFADLSNPSALGVNYTQNYNIPSTDGVKLGVWYMRKHFPEEPEVLKSASDFISSLTDNPIILYLHGNAGTRAGRHRVKLYNVLAETGFHVITLDYRGFGDSTGSPSEQGVVEDAITVYKWIRQHAPSAKIIIWGHSLGSSIGTNSVQQLCLNQDPPLGLVLEAPFNNLKEAAFWHPLSAIFKSMPWFHYAFIETLETQKLAFDTDRYISSVTVPTLILHAEDDGIVPYELGAKLYKTAKTVKSKGTVEFKTFSGDYGYGHKHLWKSLELPAVVKTFIDNL